MTECAAKLCTGEASTWGDYCTNHRVLESDEALARRRAESAAKANRGGSA